MHAFELIERSSVAGAESHVELAWGCSTCRRIQSSPHGWSRPAQSRTDAAPGQSGRRRVPSNCELERDRQDETARAPRRQLRPALERVAPGREHEREATTRATHPAGALFDGLTAGKAHDVSIFVRSNGSNWYRTALAREMRAACAGGRIVPATTFHTLRHACVSRLVQVRV